MSYKIYLNSESSAVLNIASYIHIHRDVGYITLQEQDVLTVSCPAAAESPAYHTLEKKDKNREGNNLLPTGYRTHWKKVYQLWLQHYI